MKPKMKHSNSMKAKNNGQINMLESNLFSKLQPTQPTEPKFDDLQFKMLNYPQDSLSQLIKKAKGITSVNQDKIQKAKRQLKVSKKETVGTFLTGTGMYVAQEEEQPPLMQQPEGQDVDPDSMLRELVKKDGYDDLAQLRRMIKVTGENLDDYSRQVYQTKKDVMSAANQFNSQMDFNLTCKLSKFNKPVKQSRKTTSISRIKNRYM